jgi:2-hydroxy-3-keto-5-methylthiopentenyl-1-phosphate phosphatase
MLHSEFGHDKSLEIRPYAALKDRPVMFYAGDGVSDLSAAKETDLLFAKAGRGKSHTQSFSWFIVPRLITPDLVAYCERENVPFTVFSDFSDIQKVVAEVVDGKISVKDAAKGRG